MVGTRAEDTASREDRATGVGTITGAAIIFLGTTIKRKTIGKVVMMATAEAAAAVVATETTEAEAVAVIIVAATTMPKIAQKVRSVTIVVETTWLLIAPTRRKTVTIGVTAAGNRLLGKTIVGRRAATRNEAAKVKESAKDGKRGGKNYLKGQPSMLAA